VLVADPNMGDLVQREHPQNYGGIRVGQEHIKAAKSPKRCKIGPRLLLLRTNRKSRMLQRVMNSAARVVNTRKFDSGLSRLLHDELHWLDVTDRVRFKFAVLMYRSLHGMSPSYLVNSCTPAADVACRQHLRSSSQRKFIVPRGRFLKKELWERHWRIQEFN